MTDQVRLVIAELTGFTERKVAELALDVTHELVVTTPVDTGWAKNNWIPKIGERVETPEGSRTAVSGAAQQAGMAQVATSYRLNQGPIFISNSVPYIEALNNGHSQQAPSGFVQLAVLRAVSQFK